MVETLKKSEVPVLSSHVCQRVAFAKSVTLGQTVFDAGTDQKAIAEIVALTQEIMETLGVPVAEKLSA